MGSYLWSWHRAQPTVKPEEYLTHGSGQLVQNILTELRLEIGVGLPGSHAQKAKATRRSALRSPLRLVHFVAGQLLLDELVVRLVLIERANHVIAIAPRGRTLAVDRETIRFGESRQIQPVTRPSLAVTRIREQPVDDFLVRVGRRIFFECQTSSGVGGTRSGRSKRGGAVRAWTPEVPV